MAKARGRMTRGRRSQSKNKWGDWRPFNAPTLAWAARQVLISGTDVVQEIAGQTISAAAIPVVPFDPGLQLAAAAVTLDEEETFDVQVKGHIDITMTPLPMGYMQGGEILVQSGLYRSQYRPGVGFILPDIGTAQGIADVNWLSRQHRRFNFGDQNGAAAALGPCQTGPPARIVVPVNGTLHIRQGLALYFNLRCNFAISGQFGYCPFIEYRIRKNVD